MACEDTLIRPIVYPSGAEWAIASAPTLPPEPPLFSTTNCWPVSSESFWQAMRDSTSVGPPAGNRLMYLTGLFGQLSAARAMPGAIIGAASALLASDNARRRRRVSLFNVRLH